MADDAGAGRGGKKYLWLILLVVLVVAGWSAAWLWLRAEVAERLDAEIARLDARGLAIDCPGRSVAGYPFRIEVVCPKFAVADRPSGARAAFAAARAVALIYSPRHVILEFDGPATATGPGGETASGTWRLLQTSLRFSEGALARVSLVVDGLDGRATAPAALPVAVISDRLELHLRPDADRAGFDLAASVTAGALTVDGRRVGPEKIDLSADTEVMRLPPPVGAGLPGFLAAWAANDGRLDIRSLRVAAGKLAVEGRGALALEPTGHLTGMVKLTATGLDAIGEAGAKGTPVPPDMAVLASGFLLFGKPAGDTPKAGRSLDFSIDQGRMKLGATPLGRLPPLFRPPQGS